jgi:DNA ligase-1
MTFKPLLAATLEDLQQLRFPVLASPKLDGLRCIIQDGVAVSRNLKPFRNVHVQHTLRGAIEGLDGELIVGSPNEGHVLGRTQSGIMSVEGMPEFKLYVFDNHLIPSGFQQRYKTLFDLDVEQHPSVQIVRHDTIHTIEGLLEYEQRHLDEGYEGVMIRSLNGHYKYGRSTPREGIIWKLKRFRDGEAMVMDLAEGVINNNEATFDALGHLKRSNHQENKVNAGRVGTIIAHDLVTGQPMQISPGRMTMDMRHHYWMHPSELVGKIIKYKTFDYGTLNVPRFSTFQAFRSPEDM